MNRRWFAALLLAAFGLAAAGCGGGGGSAGTGLGGGVTPLTDTDGDGIPNVTDTDDDDDGISDSSDAVPLDAARFASYKAPVPLSSLGGAEAIPSSINAFGEVAGCSDAAAGEPVQPVVWSLTPAGLPESPTALPGLTPEPSFGVAQGNNDANQIVGEASNPAGETVAVLWPTPTGAPVALPSLDPAPSNAQSAAFDINNNGLIVGQAETALFDVHPVAWLRAADGTITGALDLQVDTGDFAGTSFGRANAAADNGLVVGEMLVGPGGANDAFESRAVAWKLSGLEIVAGPVDLGKLVGHAGSAAFSVNENGVVVGESVTESGDVHAVRWTVDAATMTVTGPVDLGAGSSASAVNNSGRIAGDKAGADDSQTACSVWDAAARVPTLTELLAPAATSNRGVGINELGQIVGIQSGSGFVINPN